MPKAKAYECPNCGAAIALDPKTQMLTCAFCGGSYTVEETSERHDKKNGTKRAPRESVINVGKSKLDWGDYDQNLDLQEMEGTVYNCENCGAQVVTDGVTVATVCPYCDSALVVDERVSGGLRPNAVIPFKIPKERLADLLQDFYKDRPLLPKDFFAKNKVEKAQGVYVPFWLFDGTMEGEARYAAENSLMYVQGNDDVVETRHYKLYRAGSVEFDAIPVDGSVRMDDDVMDSIEPFDYRGMEEFDSAYFSGFVADRFDQGPDEVLQRASVRMVNSAREVFEDTCEGYASMHETASTFSLRDASVRYVLLPVYLFNTEYEGKKYRYAINGQTGKVVGEVPIGKREARRAFVIPAAVAGVVTFVVTAGVSMFLAL